MKVSEIERIKELIKTAELEQAKAQGAKDSIKAEWKKKYGFETLEEAKAKLEEISSNLEKNEKKKENSKTFETKEINQHNKKKHQKV